MSKFQLLPVASLALGAVLLLSVECPALAGEVAALQSSNGGPYNWMDFSGANSSATVGWSFQVGAQNATVTSLGLYSPAGPLGQAQVVGLWTSGGTLLTSVTVPAGAGPRAIGGFLYQAIGPVVLTAGQTYVVGAVYQGATTEPILVNSTQTYASDITFLHSLQSSLLFNTVGTLTYPTLSAGLDQGVFGPNLLLSYAQSFTATASGLWNGTTSWTPSTGFPNGTGDVANLVLPASGSNTMDLGGATFTVNQLNATGSGTGAWRVVNGTLIVDGTNPVLENQSTASGTSETIAANLQLNQTATFAIDNAGAATQVTGTISGTGGLIKQGAGTLILSGVNTYGGATAVDGGILDVEGTLSGTSAVTVNAGGVLMGAGTIGSPTVSIGSGGLFAPGSGTPGSTMAITGNLAFASGATYQVLLDPSTASAANVSGTATLGGATVHAAFANGSYIARQYTILTAGAGVSGTFGGLVETNLPANFRASLSYDANDAYLNLVLSWGLPGRLNANQQAVANALTNYFDGLGQIPVVYGQLTAGGLTQAAGELGAGSQQATFNAMGQFVGQLADPFGRRDAGAGAGDGVSFFAGQGEANAYAADNRRLDPFARFTKGPPRTFEQRWSVWGSGFGGSQTTNGNPAAGSSDATSRVFGSAVGADYLFSPNTLAGFALAGGGTNFGVNGLGSGRSDLFQAGAYLRHADGPTYVSAALAYGWQDITTDRTVTIAGMDRLHAEFDANAYSGRVEGGYRRVVPWMGGIGLTPYAAGQFTTFDLPAYAETVVSGSATFALAYAARQVTDTRSELGLRADKSLAMEDGVLTLRGRFGWAHDFNPDRAIAATFQALPGASFVVNGAAQASDSALVTASAGKTWRSGWSASATFEGEFSAVTRSYAGKGAIRYVW